MKTLGKILFIFSATITSLAQADPWQFQIAPYLWALGMNGRVQTGPVKMHIDESFSDILSQLNVAGMV